MNKSTKKIVALLSVTTFGSLCATTEFRSPLSVHDGYGHGYMHYPLDPIGDRGWHIDLWGAGYTRCSSEAFIDDCDGDSNTTKTKTLSALWFGKDSFKGEEAFASGMLTASGNPWLSFATLRPRFMYTEMGVVLGADFEKRFKDDKWRIGLRASLPIKKIEVAKSSFGNCAEEPEEGLKNVVVYQEENIRAASVIDNDGNGGSAGVGTTQEPGDVGDGTNRFNVQTAYAYRLDFLSSLQNTDGRPLVIYDDGTGVTRIAGIQVSRPTGADEVTEVPILLARRNDGKLPRIGLNSNAAGNPVVITGANPAAALPTDVNGNAIPLGSAEVKPSSAQTDPRYEVFLLHNLGNNTTELAANGQNGAEATILNSTFYDLNLGGQANRPDAGNQDRLRFVSATDYAGGLATDRAEQAKLFVTPRAGCGNIDRNARAIQNVVDNILEGLERSGNNSATAFFEDCNILLCQGEHVFGAGDLDIDFFVGPWRDTWYMNMLLGARFPTGKEHKDPGRVLFQPTGNNDHFELKLAVEGGWRPTDWFALKADASYSHAFKHKEKKAAAFTGATVKNIGPAVDADVSWGYFTGHFDLNFFHPDNPNLGFNIGYELWAKRDDNVKFCAETAVDCLGKTNTLDKCILEKNTNSMSHKVRGEVFHRHNFSEFYVGASHIFAGRQVMKETEWHIGMVINF